MHDATTNTEDRPPVGRCVIDGDRPRPVDAPGSRVCRAHRARLADMLDPAQTGQMFAKPGEHRIAGSIAVLYGGLDAQPARRGLDSQAIGAVFGSTPPGRLDVMVHRDPRSEVGDDGPHDDSNAELPVLSTLVAIARRLDVRDIHDRPVTLPRIDRPLPERPPVQWDPHVCTICTPGRPHRNPEPPPHEPVTAFCKWLHTRLDLLAAADWVADAWDDLHRLHAQLLRANNDAPPRPLGPCRKRVNDEGRPDPEGKRVCKVPLYLPPQGLKGMDETVEIPASIRCRGCGWDYNRAELVVLTRDLVAEQQRRAEERRARRAEKTASAA